MNVEYITKYLDRRSYEELEEELPILIGAIEQLLPELNKGQIALVASLVLGMCSECHESLNDCQCWNDD